MSEAKKKKRVLFLKIESRDDALKVVKDASMGFFFVAGLQAAVSYWVGISVLYDAAIYAIGGYFLRRYNSRAAAVVLLILTVLATGVTLANRIGRKLGGGNNIFLAVILLWAAIRAVEATFKLRGRFSAAMPTKDAPPM